MKKQFSVLLVGMILLAALAMPVPGSAGSEAFIHFIVVPAQTQNRDELQSNLEAFKRMLAETAGGYTSLGSTDGGALLPGGDIDKETSCSFIVASPQNISREIEAWVETHFKTGKPFILVWKGESNF